MKNGNTPAYPLQAERHDPVWGLTKREMFAMAAMQGMLANSHVGQGFKPFSHMTDEEIAQWSVKQADALLAELEKTEDKQ